MTDAESMGMLFDDPPDVPYDAFSVWKSECMNEKIDMEEVVRCKDCVLRYTDKCVLHDQAFPINKGSNWFCADGERRTNDD